MKYIRVKIRKKMGPKPKPLRDRFFNGKFTKMESGCWLWNSSRDDYGSICVGIIRQRAHRVSYELHIGRIPDGLFVLHQCDNKRCVNPDHLFLGTDQDNSDDKVSKGRQAKGVKVGGVKLDDIQVLTIRKCAADGLKANKIAPYFHVSNSTVTEIIARKIWRHI